MVHKLHESETVLPDDYPVYYNYLYIGDMKFIRNDVLLHGTVGKLKRELGLKEIRRCDIYGHEGAKLGDSLEV